VGGNLSILYSLLGSPSAIDCKDKILFIEDLDEYLYHIDRMMNLKRNGCLESKKNYRRLNVKMRDNEIPWGKTAVQIIEDVTKHITFQSYIVSPGHIHDNRALIGSTVSINVTKDGSIVIFK
jgi:muramoyltetrapeptide carboxypeptidase